MSKEEKAQEPIHSLPAPSAREASSAWMVAHLAGRLRYPRSNHVKRARSAGPRSLPEPPCRLALRFLAGHADVSQEAVVQLEQGLTLTPPLPQARQRRGDVAKPARPGPV